MIFQEDLLTMMEEALFYQEHALELAGGKEESNREGEADTCYTQGWTLYFDGSKSQEVSGVGCILINPKGK
jgi:hypothetical protein